MTKTLVHFTYHKCLTVYFLRVASSTFNRFALGKDGYRYFNKRYEDFLAEKHSYRLTSVSNYFTELDRLGDDVRATHFVRDPRDLIVSGYFYHKRGAEAWTKEVSADAKVRERQNGLSLCDYLNSVDKETGLLEEILGRENSFDVMASWAKNDDPRLLTLRYEDIIGDEVAAFGQIARHYGLGPIESAKMRFFARRYSASRTKPLSHIRDPRPSQWREHFTDRVEKQFNDRFGDLLSLYGYE